MSTDQLSQDASIIPFPVSAHIVSPAEISFHALLTETFLVFYCLCHWREGDLPLLCHSESPLNYCIQAADLIQRNA
jgi:hypothetical protein